MKEWTNRVTEKVKSEYGAFEPEKTVLEELRSYGQVFEIGSGKGRYTKLVPGLIGLEYSSHFLDYCSDHVPGLFLRGDGFRVPTMSDLFDCVYSSGVIEHFDDLHGIVREHMRICRPGGTVLIAVPAGDSPDATRVDTRQKYLCEGEEQDWHYYGRRLPDDEVRAVMEDCGLEQVSLKHLGVPLRGGREALGYLRPSLLKHPVAMTRGMALELGGYVASRRLFRKLTGDYVNQRYSATRGFYLLAKGIKPGSGPGTHVKDYQDLYDLLTCPRCGDGVRQDNGGLVCRRCDLKYPLKRGIPYLLESDGQPIGAQSVG